MRTPKEFKENLKNKTITKSMLKVSLFSVNKRAKNCRDKQLEYMDRRYNPYDSYHYYHHQYNIEDTYREQKEHYYDMKDTLLSILEPTAIHLVEHVDGEIKYFLFYELEEYSFHTPISKEAAEARTDLNHIKLDDLITFGHDINDLASVNFAQKVVSLIISGDYTYIG